DDTLRRLATPEAVTGGRLGQRPPGGAGALLQPERAAPSRGGRLGRPLRAFLAAKARRPPRSLGPKPYWATFMSEIVLDAIYPHPPDRVWRALTDREELALWLMPNDFAPVVGHKFQFRAKPQWGWRGFVECEVMEVIPPRRLTYTWQGDEGGRPMTVIWTLEPAEGGGTRLTLAHRGFR